MEKYLTQLYPLIQCSSRTSCKLYKEKIENKCQKNGDIIYSSNTNNKIFKVCKSETETINFNKLDDTKYQIINIKDTNDIPGAMEGYNIIRITKTEAVALLSNENSTEKKNYYINGAMYSCDNNCKVIIKENIIIFEELTKNLLMSYNCKSTSCEWKIYNKEGYVFIDNNDQLITDEENKNVDKLYKCKEKNGTNNIICYNMKSEKDGKIPSGYYYNNEIRDSNKNLKNTLYKYNADENIWEIQDLDNLDQCTYYTYKNNTCYISYEDEKNGYTIENPKINAENICVTKNHKLYFTLSEINTGVDESNCIALPRDNNVNYYNVNNKDYALDKYSFYNINEANLINSLNSELIKPKQPNFNGILSQGDSSIDQYTLTCNFGQCKKEKTKFCNYDFQTEKCLLVSGSIKVGQTCTSPSTGTIYLVLENIKGSSKGKCTSYSKNKSLTVQSKVVEIEFQDRKYIEVNNKLYYINSASEVVIANDGFYILDQWNYKINILPLQSVEVGPNSSYLFYTCNNGICKRKENCENGDLMEYIYDQQSQSVYQCNPLNHQLSIVNSIGYYMNNPTHDLIRCYIDYNYLLNV